MERYPVDQAGRLLKGTHSPCSSSLPTVIITYYSLFQRPRPDGEDHYAANGADDDDISLVSRSPSPAPMDIDESISKYDEYHHGAEREVVTVNTRIKPTNKGFAMLAKLGWVEGQPLGLSGDGKNSFATGNLV